MNEYKSRHKLIDGKNWHPHDVFENSIDDVVNAIADLDYNEMQELFSKLSIRLESDALKDSERGRKRLAIAGYLAAQYLNGAVTCIEKAKEISKPYMCKK